MVNMISINGQMRAVRSMSLKYSEIIKQVSSSIHGVKVTYKNSTNDTSEFELTPGHEVLVKNGTVITVHN